MVRFIKWLLGYVSFSFISGFNEGFINDCFLSKYNIQNLRIEKDILYADCPLGLYPFLRRIARKNGGRLKTVKKHGLIFILLKVKNRWGIFVGAVLGISFLCFISGFIWNIEVTGNEKLKRKEILSFASQNGLFEGAYWKSTDRDRIENLFMASYEDIAWVHINRSGTSAIIEIDESVKKPKTQKKGVYTNLKAKKDGVIVKTNVQNGWQKAKKGDAVTKGDLLISGVYTNEKGMTLFAHAKGEYIAEVKEKINVTVNRNQSKKKYLSERKDKSLLFFGLEIPLYLGKTPSNAEVETKYRYVFLGGKKIPLGVKERTVRVFKKEEYTLSDSELNALLESEIQKRLKDDFGRYEIIKKKIDTELTDSSAVAKGYVLCLEDIGKEFRIKVKSKG